MTATLHPVSLSRHNGLRWRGPSDYRFAEKTTLVSLAAAEIGFAALALPLAFIGIDNGWKLVAILGFETDQNLYVDANGAWIARYIPAAFRAYPFLIGSQGGGEATLCVDEGSGLVGADGDPFFEVTGDLHPKVAQVLRFLSDTARSEAAMTDACNLLNASGVLEPWPIIFDQAQGQRSIEGLYRISESTLNSIDANTFLELRQGGALNVAYAQILSCNNLGILGHLMQNRKPSHLRNATGESATSAEAFVSLPNDSTIDWDWSKIGR